MALEESTYFDVISDMHRPKGVFGYGKKSNLDSVKETFAGVTDYNPALPVIAFKLSDNFKAENPHVKQAAISTLLRTRGWIVPNYALPPAVDKVEILRIVVRESFSQELVDTVVADLIWAAETLAASESSFDVDIFVRKNDPVADAHKMDRHEGSSRGPSGRQC